MQRNERLNTFKQLMNNLELMIQGASRVPLTNSYMIDKTKALQLLKAIQSELPSVIVECEAVLSNESTIISTAQNEASQIKNRAQATAAKYVSDTQTKVAQLEAQASQKAGDAVSKAQQEATIMVQEAQEQANAMLAEAKQRADQLVSEQEILTRAQNEAENLKQVTDQNVAQLYTDVYAHIDSVLAQLERSISEKLTDIRQTRQQIDESMK